MGVETDQLHHSVRSLCFPDFPSGVFIALIIGGGSPKDQTNKQCNERERETEERDRERQTDRERKGRGKGMGRMGQGWGICT